MAVDDETFALLQAQMALHLATIDILEETGPGTTAAIAKRLRSMRDMADAGGAPDAAIHYLDEALRTLEEKARKSAARREQ